MPKFNLAGFQNPPLLCPRDVNCTDLRRTLYGLCSQFGPILDVVARKTKKTRGQAFVVFRVRLTCRGRGHSIFSIRNFFHTQQHPCPCNMPTLPLPHHRTSRAQPKPPARSMALSSTANQWCATKSCSRGGDRPAFYFRTTSPHVSSVLSAPSKHPSAGPICQIEILCRYERARNIQAVLESEEA